MKNVAKSCSLRAVLAFGGLAVSILPGCGIVGWQYQYGGQQYTMTKSNSAYHQKAVADVRQRYGDPSVQTDPDKLAGACELLQRYAADAPDPGQFKPARDLLDADATRACSKASNLKSQQAAAAEQKQRQEEFELRQAERQKELDERQATSRRAVLASTASRYERIVEACRSSESLRGSRRHHEDIIAQAPGETVRKQCSPRMETRAVQTECKDADGFTRTCTKAVSTGEVSTYACPASMDKEVVRLGLYQLQLAEYPYPEEEMVRVSDRQCDDAAVQLADAQKRMDQVSTNGGGR